MRKKLLAVVLALSLAIFLSVLVMETEEASCGYCGNAGAKCVTDFTCIGDCYCAKNMGSATGFCAPTQ